MDGVFLAFLGCLCFLIYRLSSCVLPDRLCLIHLPLSLSSFTNSYIDTIKSTLFQHLEKCQGHAVVIFDEVQKGTLSPSLLPPSFPSFA